jgi:hypothetical protein
MLIYQFNSKDNVVRLWWAYPTNVTSAVLYKSVDDEEFSVYKAVSTPQVDLYENLTPGHTYKYRLSTTPEIVVIKVPPTARLSVPPVIKK